MNNITYPYIPEGWTVKYVPLSNQFMAEAKKVCQESSTDRQHPTGAVIVKEGVIISKAANQSAIKNQKLLKFHKEVFCPRRILKVKSGTKYWLCPGCAASRNHAETRAAKKVMKTGDIEGTDLYLWGHWWCCKPCWDAMLKSGVQNVYLLEGSEKLFNKDCPENELGRF